MSALLRLTNTLPLAQDSAAGQGFSVSWAVNVANIVAAAAVAVSLLTLWTAWRRDVRLREIEYADRVKTAAASTLARLERAREISLHFFDVFSRSFVSADEKMQGGETRAEIKNFVWRMAERAAAQRNERLLEEEVELAYVDLYAYDRAIHDLFADARRAQEAAWERVVTDVKMWTQADVERFTPGSGGLREALRETVQVLREELRQDFDAIIDPLRNRLEVWIRASEPDIVNRRVRLTPGEPAIGFWHWYQKLILAPPPPDVPSAVTPAVMSRAHPEVSSHVLEAIVLGAQARRTELRKSVDRPFAVLDRMLQVLGTDWPALTIAIDRLYVRPASSARQRHLGKLLARVAADDRREVREAADGLLQVLANTPESTACVDSVDSA